MELSSYMVFAGKVKGSGWSRGMIGRKFNEEVDKDDYLYKEKDEILEFLFSIAQKPSKYATPK